MTLDGLLEHLDIQVSPFAMCCVASGSQLTLGPCKQIVIHYVLVGDGVLIFDNATSFGLRAGTLVLAPAGTSHRLVGCGTPGKIPHDVRNCRPLDAGLAEFGTPAGALNDGIAVLCGSLDVTYQRRSGVFDHLLQPIVAQAAPQGLMWQAFENIVRELAAPGPGTGAMLRALFQLCLIELFRDQCVTGQSELPWLSTVVEPRLSGAITEIIEHPERTHTLELLASKCAMSRSAFAARFTAVFGRPVMDFVREVRLRDAARLLSETNNPVKVVAAKVGYASRSHFSRAFHGFFGVTPQDYRRMDRDQSMPDGLRDRAQ
jgi:AraC-like DNA-binding protein